MTILGLNAFHGDSSAALFSNGDLLAAVEEERLNRVKHWAGLPIRAAAECLRGFDASEVTDVAISRNPGAHLIHKLARILLRPGTWMVAASRARNGVRVARVRSDLRSSGLGLRSGVRLHCVEHHRAHMASAFFASPFTDAAIVSVDGFGDFSSLMWGVGAGNRIRVMGSTQFPHSLGVFYTAFTQFLGFPKYGDEYKMMGLAAYGEPGFAREVGRIVRIAGTDCRLDLDYFVHHTRGLEMTWHGGEPAMAAVYSPRMADAFGIPRVPRTEVTQANTDLAASVQQVLEERYFSLLNAIQAATGQRRVCLAGGVALNCVANGKILERTRFRDVYIQPAAHDAGTSLGAALYVYHQVFNRPRAFEMRHVYFGPEYSADQIRGEIDCASAVAHRLNWRELVARTARELAGGRIVGWFQGRMEFGPRALGNRSILADPRRPEMKDVLNKRIKYREPFRPFCPSVLAEVAGQYFECDYPSPFMVQAYRIKPRQCNRIPAVTHADGTGRLQTVERDVNRPYWELIQAFGELTGVPVLLNTSFNENEPIVNTPRQALECFLRTQMDVLVLGPYLLYKTENSHISSERLAMAGGASR
jgi:carbamoyltransferase